jgi:drug/metabolite transporter (DMT)-like permease
MLIMGLIGGEPAQWHWEWRGVVAMLFLGVFGSAIAYTAYTWLIRHQPTDRVATFAYVNPLIATVLGWLVLGEALTPLQIAATIVIVAGVMIVTVAPR